MDARGHYWVYRYFRYCIFAALQSIALSATAQTTIATIPAGSAPGPVVVNPVTNTAYVVNTGDNSVTVLAGLAASPATLGVGASPNAIAINSATNEIYVANGGDMSVTVIDGTENTTNTVAVGTSPVAIAINDVTNTVYVANSGSDDVTVIDGVLKTTSTVHVGSSPSAIAANPTTNQVYVANRDSKSITIINGADNSTATLNNVGAKPVGIAVNPYSGIVYVVNEDDENIAFIYPGLLTIAAMVGPQPSALALDVLTDQVFVANSGANTTTILDGDSRAFRTVNVGGAPSGIAVNASTSRAYVLQGSHSLTEINEETSAAKLVAAGSNLSGVAVNPLLNRIYVTDSTANKLLIIDGATNTPVNLLARGSKEIAVDPVSNTVVAISAGEFTATVIDGANLTKSYVPLGGYASGIAINPVTNRAYISAGSSVTVIDRQSGQVSTIDNVPGPVAIAANPLTNRIYVVDYESNLGVIDGATNSIITTFPVGQYYSTAIAVDPILNKVYVANESDVTLYVVDGATNAVQPIKVESISGTSPKALAVNSVTHKVYIAGNVLSVLDGTTNELTTIDVMADAVAVNSLENKIYAVGCCDNALYVIDGSSNTFERIPVDESPTSVTVDQITNRVYVTHYSSDDVAIVDGATNTVSYAWIGDTLRSGAVNPRTQQAFVGGDVTISYIDPMTPVPSGLTATIEPLRNNVTANPEVTFAIESANTSIYGSNVTQPQRIYYQLDTLTGSWKKATGGPGAGPYIAALSSVSPGVHVLYAYAVDGESSTSVQTASGAPFIGAIGSYGFVEMPNSIFLNGFE